MSTPFTPTRIATWLWTLAAAFLILTVCTAEAQNSSDQSLGAVARQTRKDRATPHATPRQLVNEEEDGPDTTGVWRIQLCSHTPCYELVITLPKHPKWTRAAAEPRPVLIPLAGASEDANRVIRIYPAHSLEPGFPLAEMAAKTLLRVWFARPEYFGNPARIESSEHTTVDNLLAVISHFTVPSGAAKLRGVSVVTGSPNGNYGFACVFREQDSAEATSICEAIVASARNQVLEPAIPRKYVDPNDDPEGDPPADPPESDDPE